jgi:4-carboxymuconolactone decarboxylase
MKKPKAEKTNANTDTTSRKNMPKPTSARALYGDIAPQLAAYSETVLYGDLWERAQLSKRDRSLITCAALICLGKTEQMNVHFPKAIENGLTKEELVEAITHLAFYSGWPTAVSAALRAKEILGPLE